MASTLRKDRAAATRANVLAVATAAFREEGYEAATMRAIAGRAGVSTGAVFAHWADKADLYREIFGHAPVTPEIGAGLLNLVRKALDGGVDLAMARALVAQAEEA